MQVAEVTCISFSQPYRVVDAKLKTAGRNSFYTEFYQKSLAKQVFSKNEEG